MIVSKIFFRARSARTVLVKWSIFRGGGYMHLTGRSNYAASSKDAGVDLVADPEKILDPRISGRILFLGLLDGRWNRAGKGIRFYAEADGNPDLDFGDAEEARQTVNLKDRATDIARYTAAFRTALDKAGFVPGRKAT